MNTIDPGAVIDRAFRIYREHAAPLLIAAVLVFFVTAIASYVFDSGVSVFIALAITAIAQLFFQGVVAKLVEDVRDGTLDSSLGGLFSSVTPVIGPLIGVALLGGVAIFFGFLLLIVPGLFLLTIWAVVAPAVVLENRGLDAFSRSQQLVKGNGWQVFTVILIIWLLTFVVGFVAGIIGAVGGDVLRVLLSLVVTVAVAPLGALAAAVLFFQLRDGNAL
ncbi:hypothetical protein Q5424_06815 [Conexibacter sp. JD483]|uniref:hypothetical protein n=1 Tax=unclassified Conexibacter TaxID=2627773 RepID=UPI002719ACEE|nr:MULTISPECIES: hypothetical protein [unclassified Conexibacter]MDO8185372.1 hypothetical protein [Conexibacter sp. CPCC 205706]MDO8198452.1 hypothetical protein [Conexibacter sp. CPCC 205762]MDR9368783.1 hypothetical protein [Conexibacter sp. JD483]